jgi:small-conductance mechanosensitive channel
MTPLLSTSFLGNDLHRWIVALAVGLGTLVLVQLAIRVLIPRLARLAARTRTDWDNLFVTALGNTKWFFPVALAIDAGTIALNLPPRLQRVLDVTTAIAVLVQVGVWSSTALSGWLDRYQRARLETDRSAATTVAAIGYGAQVLVWSVVLLLSLDNLGIDITALVAGLGIGGVAVALAAQSILGDLFGSLAIVLDRPFVLGDFLALDGYLGSVEHIGLKTTRLRSLSGEQLVFSNTDLLKSRIRNYGRMRERRVVFTIGVTYQTSRAELAEIPRLLRAAVEAREQTRFDRAHFTGFGESALTFETVYYVLSADYNLYMDIQQAINLELVEEFERREIEFAYPTRTVYLARAEAEAKAERPADSHYSPA